ncbi:thermonuclease family protein [Thiobacillus denitrificans]|uniref:thermonuclease family protein n=1 Tax=Thiobacillus denitrificans TaxID=36861 RepID=UPI00036FAE19|nr:thermonuclease family protein [Thiobacillus denitrificans]
MRRLLALFLLLAAGVAWAEPLSGVVIVVIDGDTLLFRPDHYHPSSRAFIKVRLAGIDAPEKGQPYGEAATRALKDMALQQRATLEIVATDVYGRKLGRIEVDALPVNEELVRRGYAWSSSRNPYRAMRPLQDDARRAGIGLWQDPAPTPPWMWRRAQPARGR